MAPYVTHDRLAHATSNTLVVLAVPDELALGWLCRDAEIAGLRVIRVHEPDLGDALTAAAIEPAGAEFLRRLPLALKSRAAIMSDTSAQGEEVRT